MKRFDLYLIFILFFTFIAAPSVFAQNDKKVAYSILIDNTGSLRSQFPQVKELAKGAVNRTRERGPVSISNFVTERGKYDDQAVITQGVKWSQDEKVLSDYIDGLFTIPGKTALLEAIQSLAAELQAKTGMEEKVIILITDGEDRIRRTSKVFSSPSQDDRDRSKIEKRLIKTLKEGGIKVYAVGLVRELDDQSGIIRKSSRETAVDFLNSITKETGGRAVIPKKKSIDIDGLLNELLSP